MIYDGAPHSFFDRKFERVRRRTRPTRGGACSRSSSITAAARARLRAVSDAIADRGRLVAARPRGQRRHARRLLQHGVRRRRVAADLLRRARRPRRRSPEGGRRARRPARRRRPALPRRLLPAGTRRARPPDRGRTSRSTREAAGLVREPVTVVGRARRRDDRGRGLAHGTSARCPSTCSRSTGSPTRSTAATASTGSGRSSCSASAACARSPRSGSSRPSSI